MATKNKQPAPVEVAVQPEDKPLCKYCTENYLLARGRGIRQQLIPIEPNYCPMCGRKLQPTDRDY